MGRARIIASPWENRLRAKLFRPTGDHSDRGIAVLNTRFGRRWSAIHPWAVSSFDVCPSSFWRFSTLIHHVRLGFRCPGLSFSSCPLLVALGSGPPAIRAKGLYNRGHQREGPFLGGVAQAFCRQGRSTKLGES